MRLGLSWVRKNQNVLPSRSTLESWRPDTLSTSSAAVQSGGDGVRDAVSAIDEACERFPEVQAWSGPAHDAADAMFGRADLQAHRFHDYVSAVATALSEGAESIGAASRPLLSHADALDAGALNVTDQWVVLVDPVYVSEEEMAQLQAVAMKEQAVVNTMVVAVGDADNATADAVVAAGEKFGFVKESGPDADLAGLLLPMDRRPADQVPDPRSPVGMIAQEAIRSADEQQNIREVTYSTDEYGNEVTTAVKQDGSKTVSYRMDPYDDTSKMNFFMMEEFDKNGNFIARTSSWHEMVNDVDYTSITYADGSNLTMSMDPTGHRNAGFTTADGRHSAVPVELIDSLSLATTSGMSGLEKHIARGGSLPMITADSVDNIGKTMKFGGPALTAATTVFDMVMADSGKDRCVALVAGVASGAGGWGGAELGAAAGLVGGPLAPVTVPGGAILFAFFGGLGGSKLGKFIGDVVCPY
ncbi:hypothetical protein HLY00_2477 [Mycolicibacterium hippocampi]|uniref:Uncharacterized protein n=1 Tax=Mycolicibacterium hippocampi TaxID=659824 RepID=A0A850PK05_9MYCO|nr:hypothetical protein [Mycolicibacterium hippocampi]